MEVRSMREQNTARIHLALPESLNDGLERLAAESYQSKSALIRELVIAALKREGLLHAA
jgi:metal-responsive CopG/Arc/MetJ family transcriptional regulator